MLTSCEAAQWLPRLRQRLLFAAMALAAIGANFKTNAQAQQPSPNGHVVEIIAIEGTVEVARTGPAPPVWDVASAQSSPLKGKWR